MNTYIKSLCIGILAGMRSMSAPAVASAMLSKRPSEALAASPLRVFCSPLAAKVFKALAAGELVGDKLPKTPARIDPLPLAARAVSGGTCAAALCIAEGENAAAGAAIGVIAAVASSFAFYQARRVAGEKLPLSDPILGAAEDLIAGGIALGIKN